VRGLRITPNKKGSSAWDEKGGVSRNAASSGHVGKKIRRPNPKKKTQQGRLGKEGRDSGKFAFQETKQESMGKK